MAKSMVITKVDPGKKPVVVQSGNMAMGSDNFNREVGNGYARARSAGRGPSVPNVPVSSQSGGSNMGDKSVGVKSLLGRANPQYKTKSVIVKRK